MSEAPTPFVSTKPTVAPEQTAGDEFEESPLFYGRWTKEEERYAEMLIKEFQDGNLEDTDFEQVPNTLRSYLAHMLRCAPKRISKVRHIIC